MLQLAHPIPPMHSYKEPAARHRTDQGTTPSLHPCFSQLQIRRRRYTMRVTPLRLLCMATLLAASASALPQSAIARPDGTSIPTAQVDATVNQLLQSAHVTGAGIAIFHNRRIVYLKAYGLRDTDKNLPLTPDSVMTSASLSKATFAT